MSTPEKNYETKIKAFLKKESCYYFKFWGTMYTRSGVPDIIACVNGRFLGIEVKSDIGRPSPIQLQNIREIKEAGGYAVVVHPKDFDQLKLLVKALQDGNDKEARNIEGGLLK